MLLVCLFNVFCKNLLDKKLLSVSIKHALIELCFSYCRTVGCFSKSICLKSSDYALLTADSAAGNAQ